MKYGVRPRNGLEEADMVRLEQERAVVVQGWVLQGQGGHGQETLRGECVHYVFALHEFRLLVNIIARHVYARGRG